MMQSAEKVSVTMTPEMIEVIRASVASGEYASTSEAMRDAVRVWQRAREEHSQRLAAIKARVQRSVNDDRPGSSADKVRERLAALHEETAAAGGAPGALRRFVS